MYNSIINISSNDFMSEFNENFVKELLKKSNVYSIYTPNKSNMDIVNLVNQNNLIKTTEFLNTQLSESDKLETKELIKNIEDKLKISFNALILTDRHISYEYLEDQIDFNYSYLANTATQSDSLEELLLKLVYYSQKLILEIKPKFISMYSSNVLGAVFIAVANYHGIKNYNFITPRSFSYGLKKIVISSNVYIQNLLLKEEFNKLVQSNIEPSEKAIEIVENFINQPTSVDIFLKRVKANYFKMTRQLLAILKQYVLGRYNTKLLTTTYLSSWFAITFKYIIKFGYQNSVNSPKVNLDQKFSYFALGQLPELVSLEWSPEYLDQENSIKQLSRYLPYGVNLIVREHPNNVGRRVFSFYKKLKKLRNVILGSVHDSQFNYIKNAESVITINGTTGWEAIMLKKPVFYFETNFYELLDIPKKLRNYRDLEEAYAEHLKYIEEYPDDEYYRKVYLLMTAELNTAFDYNSEGAVSALNFIENDFETNLDNYNYWKTIF